MAKRHLDYLLLRILAGKVERNLLTPDEGRAIATILRCIADGESLDTIFGKRYANRPFENKTARYVEQIYLLLQPTFDGQPGLTVEKAIEEVAKQNQITTETLKSKYYSQAGVMHLAKVKKMFPNPFHKG